MSDPRSTSRPSPLSGPGGYHSEELLADRCFVNPYTFVPFANPAAWEEEGMPAFRGEPAGHAALADGRLSGQVEVELTAHSPLLLRGVVQERAQGEDQAGAFHCFPRRRNPGHEGETPFIPGSSLAGVVRSLHESVAGGCLRVFDSDFRPGYRDMARARAGLWYLARIEAVDENGRPMRVTVCPETVWVPARDLAAPGALGSVEEVRTGARVDLLSSGETVSFGKNLDQTVTRQQLQVPEQVQAGEGWTVLVTDSGVRPGERKQANGQYIESNYFCAVGRLAAKQRAVSWAEGDDAWWGRFLDAVDGTRDMAEARRKGNAHGEKPPAPVPVRFPARRTKNLGLEPKLVGYRNPARRRLYAEHVVWVRLAEPYSDDSSADRDGPAVRIEEMALSQIWRHAGGEERAGARVPHDLEPCQDFQRLCPTCRVFGSAETRGSDTAAADQKSYRGHLRFSDAYPVGGDAASLVTLYQLPPLGAPRPGAGQFYLRSGKKGAAPETLEDPLREWGSKLDRQAKDVSGHPRRLRGRKHYWLTGSPDRRPYFRATGDRADVFAALYWQEGKENAMLSRAEAVRAGTRFRYTVRFENLSPAELGGLLAALTPQSVATVPQGHPARPGIGFSVGGGRPLGFGSCTAEITDLVVASARGRYAARPQDGQDDLDAASAVNAFRRVMPPQESGRMWRALGHALCLDRVDPHQVWYPPAGVLPATGTLPAENLLPSFAFWTESRGFKHESEKRGTDPLIPLPLLGAHAQELRVVTDDEQTKRGRDQLRRQPSAPNRVVQQRETSDRSDQTPAPPPVPGAGPRPGPPPRPGPQQGRAPGAAGGGQ